MVIKYHPPCFLILLLYININQHHCLSESIILHFQRKHFITSTLNQLDKNQSINMKLIYAFGAFLAAVYAARNDTAPATTTAPMTPTDACLATCALGDVNCQA
jgi:hypothetical protein